MAAPTAAECHAMTSYYVKQYAQRYGTKPVVNRHIARYGFDSLLRDMSKDEVKTLIDFYLTTPNRDLNWFFNNYDKLIKDKEISDEDAARRARLRAESAKRAKEWRERGNTGIGSH
jgi:hypothetical protein